MSRQWRATSPTGQLQEATPKSSHYGLSARSVCTCEKQRVRNSVPTVPDTFDGELANKSATRAKAAMQRCRPVPCRPANRRRCRSLRAR
jgi:hypothetical protein